MATYKIYQLHINDEKYYEVNAKGWDGTTWGTSYTRLTFRPSSLDPQTLSEEINKCYKEGLYVHTKTIVDAEDEEDAYAIGNGMGDMNKIQVHVASKSISVGDIFVDEAGERSIVAAFGFEDLSSSVTLDIS